MRLEGYTHFTEVKGLRIRYADAGDGPPVLLVHGLGMGLEAWLFNIPALAGSYRVLAPDLPGFGLSDVPQNGMLGSWEAAADLVAGFLDNVGISEPVSLAAQSMGGLIAGRFALAHPQRVNRLILIDSAGLGREIHLAARLAAIRPIGELFVRPSRLAYKFVARLITVRRGFASDTYLDNLVDYGQRPGVRQSILAHLRGLADTGGQTHIFTPDELHRLTMPTLIVWGERDRAFPLKHVHYALENIPNCHAVAFRGIGHAPPMERPEPFNDLLLDFLKTGTLHAEDIPESGQLMWV